MIEEYSLFIIYFCVISIITAIITIADKIFAKKNMWRIPEKTLLLSAVLGGAPVEYLTMRLIRHKTQHKKFMLGLPLIIILQLTAVIIFIFLSDNH